MHAFLAGFCACGAANAATQFFDTKRTFYAVCFVGNTITAAVNFIFWANQQ